MQRIHKKKPNVIEGILQKLFLYPSQTPEIIEEVIVFIEILTFSAIIIGVLDLTALTSIQPTNIFMIVALLLSAALKYFLGLTFIRAYYLLFIVWVSAQPNSSATSILIIFLTVFNLLLDVLSRIQFHVSTSNPHSQTINFCKFLHYLVLTISIFFYCSNNADKLFRSNQWVSHLMSGVLFLALISIKSKSICRSFFLKDILMRFYTLSICCYAVNIIQQFWSPSYHPFINYFLIFSISQGTYSAVNSRYKGIELDSEISVGNIIELLFKLLSYYHGSEYDRDYHISLASFLQTLEENQPQEEYLNKNNESQNQSEMDSQDYQSKKRNKRIDGNKFSRYFQTENMLLRSKSLCKTFVEDEGKVDLLSEKLFQKMSELLGAYEESSSSPSSKTYIHLLATQLVLNLQQNVIKAKQAIQITKQQCHKLAFIERLCIYKMQKKLYKMIEQKYKKARSPTYNEFMQNEELRVNIIKNCYEYFWLWENVAQGDPNFVKMEKQVKKIIERQDKIDKIFQKQVRVRCRSVTNEYIEYLFQVRRDVKRANKVLRDFEIFQENHHDFSMQKKLYVCISLSERTLLNIQCIGHNVKKLLGYQKNDVSGANVSIFLPEFYQKYHQNVIRTQVMEMNSKDLSHFQKSVIAKHRDGYYIPCILDFKLLYNNDGHLVMEGLIQFAPDSSYNWENYFFVKKEDEQLVEVGPALQGIIQLTNGKIIHYSQYFQNEYPATAKSVTRKTLTENSISGYVFGENDKKYMLHDGSIYEYKQVKTMVKNEKGQKNTYLLYVCKVDNPQNYYNDAPSFNFGGFFKKFIIYQKHPISYFDFETNILEYFALKKQALRFFNQPKARNIFLASLVLVLLAIGSKAFNMQTSIVALQKRSVFQQDLQNIVDHYEKLSKLAMQSFKFRYKSEFDYQIQIPNLTDQVLIVQQTNQRLGKYSSGLYGRRVPRSAVFFPKKLQRWVSQYLAQIFIAYEYDSEEGDLMSLSSNRLHGIQMILFDGISEKYLDGFQQKLQIQNFQVPIIYFVLLALIMVIVISIISLSCCLQSLSRQNRFVALNTLSKINCSKIFINSIQIFLGSSSGSINKKQCFQNQSDWQIISNTKRTITENKRLQQSGAFSSRQNSARNLIINEDFFNQHKTIRSKKETGDRNQSMASQNDRRKQLQEEYNKKKKIKTKQRSKKFIVFWASMFLITVIVPGSYFLFLQVSSQVDFAKSLMNLTQIYRKYILFSNALITYSSAIMYEDQMVDIFHKNLMRYKDIQTQDIIFDEVKLEQFKQFTQIYQKFNYAYLCTYRTCDPNYEPYSNILYSTTIQKIVNFMSENVRKSVIENDQFDLRAIFYTDQLLREITTQVVQTYLSNFRSYKKNRNLMRHIFQSLEILILCGWVIIIICYYVLFYRKKLNLDRQIIDLIKQDSYTLEN